MTLSSNTIHASVRLNRKGIFEVKVSNIIVEKRSEREKLMRFLDKVLNWNLRE
jgi:hypothetical protein